MDTTREQFEELVGRALDTLPPELAELADNVVVLVEDEPPEGRPGLLGLYEGVPLTERDSGYSMQPPDRITIFRVPLQARCEGLNELVEQVRVTVVHEVAHHFGIEDDRLDDLGYA